MTEKEQMKAAKQFSEYWKGKGDEKGESQKFWLSLLRDVFGIEHPESFINFEDRVFLSHTGFIDGYISETKVLIEQKALNKDLNKPIRQSDGTYLSPFQQAKRYISELPLSKHPRWVVTCNFAEFYVYDMEKPNGEPEIIYLKDLPKEVYRLSFLTEKGSEHLKREIEVSIAAGEIVGQLYDLFLKQYKNPSSEEALKSLNKLCVRLVFCLYAEDAGIFGKHGMFHDYLSQYDTKHIRRALIELFKILDKRHEERDPYLEPELAAFPYVNGGLFADENIEVPSFTDEIRDLLLTKASADFNWAEISPTIFGAVFESTLNPETRRSGGMHYTSIENIHKVIDPLFLDGLNKELEEILSVSSPKGLNKRLDAFTDKLSRLKFLDPACGSGNFLTETYISLRRLENKALRAKTNQIELGDEIINPIKVSISQFYGIEINDFAVTVAKTALWIAESQMMKETEAVAHFKLDFLPLKSYANIIEGNALKIDWQNIVPKEELNYIMGNPPFVGYSLQTKEQKSDILRIYVNEKGKPYKTAGKIDYVSGWYFKASLLMYNTAIRAAFVSTNSITQGEQVAGVWKPLYDRFNIHIDFAHRTFRWDSEASLKAHVHCIIVGFSCAEISKNKRIFDNGKEKVVKNINPFLIEAPIIFIENRSVPICDAPKMTTGNRPADGGHLIIEKEDYDDFIKRDPVSVNYIKRFMGSAEYINKKERYCLWLVGVSPAILRKMPEVMKRIELCRKDRLNSPDKGRQKLAETPAIFRETQNPSQYIIIPKVSSEQRKYIPCGFMNSDVIPSDLVFIIPNATLYHFGVLTSNVHMAWMRAVAGRLKSDYRYSKDIVYNNFPWCTPNTKQKERIEKTADGILNARSLYHDCSLADLYDENTMPSELRKAHQQNDRAVMEAYGFNVKTTTESICVAELMKLYKLLTDKV